MMKRVVLLAVLALVALSAPVLAQWQIVQGEDTNVKLGVLLQAQGDWTQNAVNDGYAQNLFLRRFRVLLGGQIMPGLTFFAETDNPNLGKASANGTKTISSGLIVQDAYLEWKPSTEFFVDAGLILVPFCRNCLNGAASHMTIDYGSYSFVQSAATSSVTGRDTGFQVRGYLLSDRLEYRAALTQGTREAGSRNPFRTSGRVQIALADPEIVPFFYPGTYFGKKTIFNIGGGWDKQQDYNAYAADAFLDLPAGPGSVTGELDWIHYDGGDTFATLAKQDDMTIQAGYYLPNWKFFPYFRYEQQNFKDSNANDSDRFQVGLGWFIKGHNLNLKAGWTRYEPNTGKRTDEYTIQLQGFYF